MEVDRVGEVPPVLGANRACANLLAWLGGDVGLRDLHHGHGLLPFHENVVTGLERLWGRPAGRYRRRPRTRRRDSTS